MLVHFLLSRKLTWHCKSQLLSIIMSSFIVWMPTLCQGVLSQSSFCGLFCLILPEDICRSGSLRRGPEMRNDRQEVGDWHLWSETQTGLDRWRAGLQYSLTGSSRSYRAALKLGGPSELSWNTGRAGVSCIDPLLEEVYPLSKGCMTLCSWGLCSEKVVTVTWHPPTASITQTDDTNA